MDARLRDLFERRAGSLGTGFMLLLLAGLWFLLFAGEDLEARDIRGRTPLIVAAEAGDAAQVAHLLEQGALLEALDDCRWSAMMRAAASGHAAIVERLLDAGAAIDRRDKSGYTAVMAAVINNRPEVLEVLLARQADLDQQEDDGGNTALMWAARDGHAALLQRLLAAGADPARRNKAGDTAEDIARRRVDPAG